jgi:lysophospholipase L1-like esterase
MRVGRTITALVALIIGLVTLAAPVQAGQPVWYLALGDSLSVGVQPLGAGGENVETLQGYADQLYLALKAENPDLQLKKLGCAVTETTRTMLRGGGECTYPHKTQLAEAIHFLRKHRGQVALVTIDVGANDVETCVKLDLLDIDDECFRKGFIQIATHLPPILAALRVAAGPHVPIVGMNYYNPVLAAFLIPDGPGVPPGAGPALAAESAEKLAAVNGLLGATYRIFKMPFADVAAAFQTNDTTPVPDFGGLPNNVVQICLLTYQCPPFTGLPEPNIHPNVFGYATITGAFREVLP